MCDKVTNIALILMVLKQHTVECVIKLKEHALDSNLYVIDNLNFIEGNYMVQFFIKEAQISNCI